MCTHGAQLLEMNFNLEPFQVIDDIHSIYDLHNTQTIIDLTNKIIDFLHAEHGLTGLTELKDIHKFVAPADVNNIRVSLFHYINSLISTSSFIHNLCGNILSLSIGPDYVVQRKINLSIQMPHDSSSVLPMHSDCISGDSPWQLNVWIPLTSTHSSASMFLISRADTLKYLEQLKNSQIDSSQYSQLNSMSDSFNRTYVSIKFGQVLLFHPGVLHGNTVNLLDFSRLSLNVRVKSLFTPDAGPSNPDRQFGTYYKLANLTEASKFSSNLSSLFS